MPEPEPRILCWFSCGVTSAVAAKMTLEHYPDRDVQILYCDTRSEHHSNVLFRRQCEEWFERPVTVLQSKKYFDIWDVFAKTRYLVGPAGARCTVELKKVLRFEYQRPGDIHVFGYDSGEPRRIERFRAANHDLALELPLDEEGISKTDCLETIAAAGIKIPDLYKQGLPNNNCIGCPKGGQGYWNRIRILFPDVFARMAKVERSLNVAINETRAGRKGREGKRQRIFLDELDPEAGRNLPQPNFSCGVGCAE